MPPLPKRSEERRRRNAVPGLTRAEMPGEVVMPPLPGNHHEVAVAWYESLGESGQSQYFEPSDWAAAQFVAFAMSKVLRSTRFNGAAFAAVFSSMEAMLTTEAARRRARIEVERAMGEAAPTGPTKIDEARKRLGVG
jgi:hypothetical protein